MKKSKKAGYAYFLVPLAALVVFLVIYTNFDKGYEQHIADQQAAIRAAKQKKVEEDNASREEAVKIAVREAAERKAAKKAKDEADQKRRDDRQTAFQVRDKAQTDAAQLHDKVLRLRSDKQQVLDDIRKIQQDKATLVIEKQSVDEVTIKAEANAKSMAAVLEKIKAADDAMVAAAAQAAKNAKKS